MATITPTRSVSAIAENKIGSEDRGTNFSKFALSNISEHRHRCHSLPPHQPKHPPAEVIHTLKQRSCGNIRDIAPSNGDANARLGFLERAASGFKPKASISSRVPEPLRYVERDRTDGATKLRREVPIFPLNGFNEWPSHSNDTKRMF